MTTDTALRPAAAGIIGKLAKLQRQNGLAGLARHVRIAGMQRLHTLVERRRGPDATAGRHELSELTVASANVSHGVHFLSTPWAVLDWMHAALPTDKSAFTFVDLGAGKGRAVLSAAARPYKRVIGVEFARELAATAAANVAATGHRPERVSVIEADATTFDLPAGPLVVFLFNPFGPPVLDAVVARIEEAGRTRSDPVIVAYLNPVHADRLAGLGRIGLRLSSKLRFAAMSPYRLNLYLAGRPRRS